MEKLNIPYTIIVEGKYDRLKLLNICNARVITTDGFGILKKNEKLALIRKLAEKLPIIVLTDSDGAGKLIRSHLTSAIPPERIIQLYTPRIAGKEKRKAEASAEGVLGVEGMSREVLERLLSPFITDSDGEEKREKCTRMITKVDFFEHKLTGYPNSSERRRKLCALAELPDDMTRFLRL